MADDKPLSRWQIEHGKKPAPPPAPVVPEVVPEPTVEHADDLMTEEERQYVIEEERQYDLGLTDEPDPDPNDPRAQFIRMIMDSMDEYQKEKAREKS